MLTPYRRYTFWILGMQYFPHAYVEAWTVWITLGRGVTVTIDFRRVR